MARRASGLAVSWNLGPSGALPGRLDLGLARLMGTSVKMIDKTYGHLARDSEDAIRARLKAAGPGSTRSGTSVSRCVSVRVSPSA
jgi:hypothetical protein